MKREELIRQIDESRVVAAIQKAEKVCSGEVRVHVETTVGRHDLQEYGKRTFERLGMTKTEARNGVLIFIAAKEQRFVILGDTAIHEKVGTEFWEAVASHMEEHFREGRFTDGIVHAIEEVGAQLESHFPYHCEDVNELPDTISRGSGPGEESVEPGGEETPPGTSRDE